MTQQQATPEEAKFEELKTEKPDKDAKPEQPTARDLGFVLDIPLALTVQLGKTKMLIKDLLQLGQGSIIELDKLAGEPMEILVNNKLVAKGEVVILNERLGIRLTDIISPTERIKQLK
jgi:flagellar motor switch protein FliN/FliY